jgi:ubiquinone/menaquinone biosynthesis C-methylase UbiE
LLDQDRNELSERYRKRWKEFGYDSRTLGWNKDCQWVRFSAAFEDLLQDDCTSVLDIGCGFGDMLGYLRSKEWSGRYTGLDLVDELITEARKRYAGDRSAEFVCGDVSALDGSHKSDMAVALGVFNHRLHQDNLQFVRETIEKMWQSTTRVVVCDFLSVASEAERRRDDLYYADPASLYQLAAGYSRRIAIHHAYMPFEFQIKIWHDDSFQQSAPAFAPYSRLASAQTEWRKRRTAEE